MAGPYCLRRDAHCSTVLAQLFRDDTFADVILTAEGKNIKAHKSVLSLASSYFQKVLWKEPNTQSVIVFRDVEFRELKNLVEFIYTGEVIVDAHDLQSFMNTAQSLEILSLCEPRTKRRKNSGETTELGKRLADFINSPLPKSRKLSGSSASPSRSPSRTSNQSKPLEIKTEPNDDLDEDSPDQEEVKDEKDESRIPTSESSSSFDSPGTSLPKPDAESGDFPTKDAVQQSLQEEFSLVSDPVTEGQWSAIEEAARNAGFMLGRSDAFFPSNESDDAPISPSFTFARGRIYPSPAQDSLKKLILRTEAEVNELYARLDANLASLEDRTELDLKRNALLNYKKLLRSKINAARRSMKSREKRKLIRERIVTAMAASKAC